MLKLNSGRKIVVVFVKVLERPLRVLSEGVVEALPAFSPAGRGDLYGDTMSVETPNSDADLLDLIRIAGSLSVSELADAMEVTATAVRQRLTRLMSQAMISREPIRAGRGRPKHRYSLTEKGMRQTGSNFTDLAFALWSEIKTAGDDKLRSRPFTADFSGAGSRLRLADPRRNARGTAAIACRPAQPAADSGQCRHGWRPYHLDCPCVSLS